MYSNRFKEGDCTAAEDKPRALLLQQRSCLGSFTAHAAEAARYNSNGTKSMSASMPMTKNPEMVRGYRDEIALHIIREAERLHPQAILFHFNSRIQKVDLDRHTVHASTADAASVQVRCQHKPISGSLGSSKNQCVFSILRCKHFTRQASRRAVANAAQHCLTHTCMCTYVDIYVSCSQRD